jgi:hypothetical protein
MQIILQSNILERTDLEIYYQKISKAFATIPDTSGDPATDQIQARVEENRIVGPISDEYRILQITRNGQTATAVTVDEFDNPRDHGFSVGVNINVSGVTGSTGPQSELGCITLQWILHSNICIWKHLYLSNARRTNR